MPSPQHAPDPALTNECDAVAAMRDQAEAVRRLADVFEKGFADFKPAADTIAGAGARLDRLCQWLQGRWPWVFFAGAAVVLRTVNAAPEDVPRLIAALATLAKALGLGTT